MFQFSCSTMFHSVVEAMLARALMVLVSMRSRERTRFSMCRRLPLAVASCNPAAQNSRLHECCTPPQQQLCRVIQDCSRVKHEVALYSISREVTSSSCEDGSERSMSPDASMSAAA
eukprot:4826396-Amphidinium_carterae.1